MSWKAIFYFHKLRVRDLEGAVEVEKSAVDEAKHNLDTLTKQHRFVLGLVMKLSIIVVRGINIKMLNLRLKIWKPIWFILTHSG